MNQLSRPTVLLALLLALPATGMAAQAPGKAAANPQARALQEIIDRAEDLSKDQIDASVDVNGLERLAKVYRLSGDKQRYRWTLERLVNLVPGSLQVKLALAASYAADDMKTPAYNLLMRAKAQGFGVDIEKAPQFEKIRGTEVWDYIVDNLQANLKPFGEGHKAFDLPATDLMLDALAWDPLGKSFLAASTREGTIYRVSKDGKLRKFIDANSDNKLWSALDLAVDGKRGRLWVATTALVYFKGYNTDNAGQAALLEFDLRSGKLLHRYPLTGYGSYLTALALAPDGALYAADGLNKVLYKLVDGQLKEMGRNPQLTDISSLVVSADGKTLYMADSVIGIIGMDLTNGKAFSIGYNREGLVLPGIVDLQTYRNSLIVVQRGMQPQRVMRLMLSEDGRSITSAMPLDVAHPLFKSLGDSAVVDNKLYFLTLDQHGKYDRYGMLREGAVLAPTPVFVSDMNYAWGQGGVNMGGVPVPKASPAQSRKYRQELKSGKN